MEPGTKKEPVVVRVSSKRKLPLWRFKMQKTVPAKRVVRSHGASKNGMQR
jgi:hypothetical protein